MTVDDLWKLTARMDSLHLRSGMVHSIRRFFHDLDFIDVETPLLIPAPAPEEHIEAVPAGKWFLQTSPELCMKRLLAAGYEKIFQIGKCFRKDERGGRHLPEFTILEWYRAHADYYDLMEDCENMVGQIASDLGMNGLIFPSGRQISLEKPWGRITVDEAFIRYAGRSVSETLEKGCFDETLTTAVEPHLGVDRPVFLCDYPKEMAALARLKEGAPERAERFELYMGGMEIANAFSELTDPLEQSLRFREASRKRAQAGYAAYPEPEPFLRALSHMPPSAGIALGVDRLAMLFTGRELIDDVVAFTPEML